MGAFSIWHWLIVLAIVVVVFGTKKLRNMGGDLGSAIKGFKEGMKESENLKASKPQVDDRTIEGEVKEETQQASMKQSETENIFSSTAQTNDQPVQDKVKEKAQTKV